MKRTVFASFAAMLILSTAVTAQAAHTHEYTKQNSKVYVCECGKEIYIPTKEQLMEEYGLVEKN